MTKKFRTKLFNLTALALVLSLAMPWSAFADDLVADGDGLTPVATSALDFGNVCANSTTTKPVLIAVIRAGNSNSNTYKSSSTVTVSVNGTPSGTGLSATVPTTEGNNTNLDKITLPSTWEANSTDNGI